MTSKKEPLPTPGSPEEFIFNKESFYLKSPEGFIFNEESFYESFYPKIEFVKTHPDAVLPYSNHDNWEGTADSGYDLTAVEDVWINSKSHHVVPVGLKLAFITKGYWFRIEARSGLGFKHQIFPHFGIIDNQYRGDLGVLLYNLSDKPYHVQKGDRIAQLVIYPLIRANIREVREAQQSTRGEKGFGSSGR